MPTLPDVGTGTASVEDIKANGIQTADSKDLGDKKDSEKGRSGESASTTQVGEGGSPPTTDVNMASSTNN